MDAPTTRRERYLKRYSALYNERTTWVEHWRDLGEYILPRRFRYLLSDRNKGWKRGQNIINNTATRSLETLASGIIAGASSPARKWIRLSLENADLAEYGPAREWLDEAVDAILAAFARSNVYNALHTVYEDIAAFGVTALHLDEDSEDAIRAYVWPIGQYMLANSARLQVDSCYREFSMTAGQLVESFGKAKCSPRVQDAYGNGRLDEWVEVLHVLEPNRDYAPGRLGPRAHRWHSCWMEKSSDTRGDAAFLRESGYDDFPVMCPRWLATGEDVYGYGRGMVALGDVRALQQLERRGAQVVDKLVNPPMVAPSSLQHQRMSMLPGETIYVDANVTGQVVRPAIEIHPQALTATEAKIREHESRIKSTFYADLWLMMQQAEATDMTAREVNERHEEKLLQLGPVMMRLDKELYTPLVTRTLAILLKRRLLRPPPPELRGQAYKVEYISIMTQAMKMLASGGIERFTQYTTNLSTVAQRPDVLDVVNLDKAVTEMADSLGVSAHLIVPEEQVQAIRAQRAKQQAAQAHLAAMESASKSAKNLAGADMTGDNALTRATADSLPLAAQGGVPGAEAA